MTNTRISEKVLKVMIVVIVALLVIILAAIVSLVFNLSLVENLIMISVLVAFYGIFGIFIVGDVYVQRTITVERPVTKEIIKEVDRPVEIIRTLIKEVPIQIPIENSTVEVIDRPVIQRIEVPVYRDRAVYIEKPRKKLSIPKFKFIGSNETKRYHTRFCRLGKLVKKKNKVHNNSKSFFVKRRFKACKACILKQKKI